MIRRNARAPAFVWPVLVVLAVAGCFSDDRPTAYLHTLPEDGLVYPDAEVTCTSESPEEPYVEGVHPATTVHCFHAVATRAEVEAWYAKELEPNGWERRDLHTTGDDLPQWIQAFITLQLNFRTAPRPSGEDPDGTIRYSATLYAGSHSLDRAPLDELQALDEADLALPASSPTPWHGDRRRSVSDTSIHAAHTDRQYRTRARIDDILAFYEAELEARGWEAVDPPPPDVQVDSRPLRAWRKDEMIARLSAHATIPAPSSGPDTVDYTFTIAEELRPDETPGVPWD